MDERDPTAPRVLVANEPRLYREVIAAMLAAQRPRCGVLMADPPDLDAAVLRHRPDFVVCSGLTEVVRREAVAWAVLYPAGSAHADIGLAGARLTMREFGFGALVVLLDCAAGLAQLRENEYPRMS